MSGICSLLIFHKTQTKKIKWETPVGPRIVGINVHCIPEIHPRLLVCLQGSLFQFLKSAQPAFKKQAIDSQSYTLLVRHTCAFAAC